MARSRLTAASAVHRQTFRVHSYDTDPAGRLRCRAPSARTSRRRRAATPTPSAWGWQGLIAEGRAWMLHRLRVEIESWPAAQDEIVVLTWPTRFSACGGRARVPGDGLRGKADLCPGREPVGGRRPARAQGASRLTEAIRGLPVGEAPGVALGPAPELPRDAPAARRGAALGCGRADHRSSSATPTTPATSSGPSRPSRTTGWRAHDAWPPSTIAFRREARRADPDSQPQPSGSTPLRLGHELRRVRRARGPGDARDALAARTPRRCGGGRES